MPKKRIIKSGENVWKIVLIKTINNVKPVYYRLANLSTFEQVDIPAYMLLIDIIKNQRKVINLDWIGDRAIITNEQGYEDMSSVILIDEFSEKDDDTYSNRAILRTIFDNKSDIVHDFNADINKLNINKLRVNDTRKLVWTCKNGHNIRCSFAIYYNIDCNCPICEMEKRGETPSLKYWAGLSGRQDILKAYELAENKVESNRIAFNSASKIKLLSNSKDSIETTLRKAIME